MSFFAVKKPLIRLAVGIGAIVSLIIFSVILQSLGSAGLQVIAANMAEMGAPCGITYLIADNLIFKPGIQKKYLHLLLYPAATFISAFFLFFYSMINLDKGVSLSAHQIAMTPIFIACVAGTMALFSVRYMLTRGKAKAAVIDSPQ